MTNKVFVPMDKDPKALAYQPDPRPRIIGYIGLILLLPIAFCFGSASARPTPTITPTTTLAFTATATPTFTATLRLYTSTRIPPTPTPTVTSVVDSGTGYRVYVENIPVSATAVKCYGYHRVKTGQNLTGISAAWRVSLDSVIRENGLKNPNIIPIGKVLAIPIRCATPTPATTRTTISNQKPDTGRPVTQTPTLTPTRTIMKGDTP